MKSLKIAALLSLSVVFVGCANVAPDDESVGSETSSDAVHKGLPAESWEWLQSTYLNTSDQVIGVVYKNIPEDIFNQANQQYAIPIEKSTFTKSEYFQSQNLLPDVGLKDESSFFVADYDVDRKAFVIRGGFDENSIPEELANNPNVLFEYSDEPGGRATLGIDSAPH